jgi:methyltransferase (TIGR00027 family)
LDHPNEDGEEGLTPIRDVSDTALWVAMYRAIESERPDALFRDPYARRLAGDRGARLVESVPKAWSFAWSMIVRTAVMNEIILRLVEQGTRTIINLGAGLDARAYWLALPATLRWFDVDLPGIVAYRQEHLADAEPACVHEDVAVDLLDEEALRQVLARAGGEDGPVLVLTEGLLVYLTPARVRMVAGAAHDQPLIRWWLTDLGSPLLLQMLGRTWQPHLESAGAPMQFAPAEGTAFFQPLGWREAEFHSTWIESMRLGRSMPFAQLSHWLGKFRRAEVREAYCRMSGIVLLERI